MAYKRHIAVVEFTIPIVIFGIIGNVLVIISILRRRSLLTSNYYFVVLHLAICDLMLLVEFFVHSMTKLFERNVEYYETFCLFMQTGYLFAVAGALMMLIIAILRYRASAYPLKTPISKRKLKVFCVMVYIVSFILGYAIYIPICA